MDQTLVAFGPHDTFVFSNPLNIKWSLPSTSALGGIMNDVQYIHSMSLGDSDENYFLNFVDRHGNNMFLLGTKIPEKLRRWLNKDDQAGVTKSFTLRVCLGSGDSFIAWDHESIRWSGIPPELEETLQSWLSPAGWKYGPPRLVALGQNGSFFVISEFGGWAHHKIPNALSESWQQVHQLAGQTPSDVLALSLSPSSSYYAILFRNYQHFYSIPAMLNSSDFFDIIEGYAPPEMRLEWESKRSEGKMAEVEEGRKHAAEMEEQRLHDRNSYYSWKALYKAQLDGGSLRREFPYLPKGLIRCQNLECLASKANPNGLRCCKHDLEGALRSTGNYCIEFLRQERLDFHPDRFGQRCDLASRDLLIAQSTEMYQMFETLLNAERVQQQGH